MLYRYSLVVRLVLQGLHTAKHKDFVEKAKCYISEFVDDAKLGGIVSTVEDVRGFKEIFSDIEKYSEIFSDIGIQIE